MCDRVCFEWRRVKERESERGCAGGRGERGERTRARARTSERKRERVKEDMCETDGRESE